MILTRATVALDDLPRGRQVWVDETEPRIVSYLNARLLVPVGDQGWNVDLPPIIVAGGVPLGGNAGDELVKTSNADLDVEWQAEAASWPAGGLTGQVPAKLSNANGDADWGPYGVPAGGPTGARLAKLSNADGDLVWALESSSIPAGDTDYTTLYDGANWNARNNATGLVDFSGTDLGDVCNRALAKLTAYGLAWTHTRDGKTQHYPYPTAPSVALYLAGAGVDDGEHYYVMTALNASGGESPPSRPIRATTGGGNNKVRLTVPTGPAGTTQRKIYRSVAGAVPFSAIRDPEYTELWLVDTIDNAVTTYDDTKTDAAIGALGTNVQLSDNYPKLSDGGSIRLTRPPGMITDGVLGGVPLQQTIQMSTRQALFGVGRALRLQCQASMRTQIGTLHVSLSDTTGTSVQVTETVGAPIPALPFAISIPNSLEVMLVSASTMPTGVNSAGGVATYTVVRGYASWPKTHTGAADSRAVYVSTLGAGRMGAVIDAYNADSVTIDRVSFNGQSQTHVGILQKRTKAVDAEDIKSDTYITWNDCYGTIGTEFLVGKPFDTGAGSNMWAQFNHFDGSNGPAGIINLGDGFYLRNNFMNGCPGVILNGSTIQFQLNHVAAKAGFNCIEAWGGSGIEIQSNYIDNVQAGQYGVYRPAGLTGSLTGLDILNNNFNCSNQVAGDRCIGVFTDTDRLAVIGNRVGFGASGCYLLYTSGANAVVDLNRASGTPGGLYDHAGATPVSIGPSNMMGTAVTGPVVRRKTDSTPITNQGTLQLDDTLKIASISASDVWLVEGILIFTAADSTGAAATGDVQVGWDLPTGWTALHGSLGGTSSNVAGFGAAAASASPNALKTESQALQEGAAAVTFGMQVAALIVGDGVHTGVITLKWSQNTANAATLVLNKNSLLRGRLVA